jgi:hypothetical protein
MNNDTAPKPKQEPQDPMSVLDFVREQIAAKEAAKGTEPKVTEPKPDPKEPEQKKEETKTEPAKEAPKAEDTDELKLSRFTEEATKEPAKEEEKTEAKGEEEEAKEEEVKLPDTASQSAKDAFKKVNSDRSKLRKELSALKKEKTELESKIKEATSEEATKKVTELESELQALRDHKEKAEAKLYALDVQSSEQYQKTITEPLSNIASEVDSIAEKYKIDAKTLRKAMASDDTSAIAELMDEAAVNDFDKVTLAKLKGDVKDILRIRRLMEEDSKRAADAMQKAADAERKQFEAEKRNAYAKSLEEHRTQITSIMPFVFKKAEGDEQWNGLVDQFDTFLKTADPTQFTAEKTAQAMAMAGATPLLFATIDRLLTDNKMLVGKVRKMTKASPSAGPTGATPQGSAPSPNEGSISDFVKSYMRSK